MSQTQEVCQTCSTVSAVRAARFCGRCGAALPVVDRPRPGWAGRRVPAVLSGAVVVLLLSAGLPLDGDRLGIDLSSVSVGAVTLPEVGSLAAPRRARDLAEIRPTATDLHGVWWQAADRQSWLGLLIALDPDGSFAIGSGGLLVHRPTVEGRWDLDGDTLTLVGLPACHLVWKVGLREDSRLELRQPSGDDAGPCSVPRDTRWTLARVSATEAGRPEGVATSVAAEPSVSGRVATPADLRGVWLRVNRDPDDRQGTLLALGIDGTLIADDAGSLVGNPSVRGRWTVDEGEIAVSVEPSSTCALGLRWSWQTDMVELGLLEVEVVRKTPSHRCSEARIAGRIGDSWSLIRLSPFSVASTRVFALEPGGIG